MLVTTFLNYATKRLRAGAIVALITALITALSITLLSACADGNDMTPRGPRSRQPRRRLTRPG